VEIGVVDPADVNATICAFNRNGVKLLSGKYRHRRPIGHPEHVAVEIELLGINIWQSEAIILPRHNAATVLTGNEACAPVLLGRLRTVACQSSWPLDR